MTQMIKTRNPLLQQVEMTGLGQLSAYRRFAHEDSRQGQAKAASFWRMLARSAVADVRLARRTQAEIG